MTLDELRSKAFLIIARRALTRKELKERLHRKKASVNQADVIVNEFYRKGYIDEKAIVEDALRLGKESRLVGRFLLRYELTKRGIKPDKIEEALDKDYPESDELEIARQFVDRKLHSYKDLPAVKRYRRLAGALNRRGFAADKTHQVLKGMGVEPFEEN